MTYVNQSPKELIDGVKFPPAGKYVIAVSGGVDSVALLDILAKRRELDLVVGHFDHRWREDSHLDAELVRSLSLIFNLPYYLGAASSAKTEEEARRQRYDFLYGLAGMVGAAGIVTAHHLDDRIETSFFNNLRGTSRKGREAFLTRPGVFRPLSELRKTDLIAHAKNQGLPWREDSTNKSLDVTRNFIRHEILPVAGEVLESKYRLLMDASSRLGRQIEVHLDEFLAEYSARIQNGIELDRAPLQGRTLQETAEILAHSIRQLEPGLQLTKERLKDLAHAAKTARPGIQKDIAGRLKLKVAYDRVAIRRPR